MDRRYFCKTFLFMPFLSPLLNASTNTNSDLELQLITSSPHNVILPLLKEIQKTHMFRCRDFTVLNYFPQKEELIKVLSKNQWRYVLKPSQADFIITFCRLLNPTSPSFTLIKKDKVWDIRHKNLFSLWQEMNKNHQPSSWLTIVSFNRKKINLRRGSFASVYIDGKKVESLSLKNSYSKSFKTKRGKIDVLIEKGNARVVDSSCRKKICLNTSPVSLEGERIICAPNHFLLEIDSFHFIDTVIG